MVACIVADHCWLEMIFRNDIVEIYGESNLLQALAFCWRNSDVYVAFCHLLHKTCLPLFLSDYSLVCKLFIDEKVFSR